MNYHNTLAKVGLIGCLLMGASLSWAQQTPAPAPEKRDSDRLDIKQLEDKYWAAKDDDFSVVQNRAYPKAKRYYATLQGGIPVNDPYSDGTVTGLNVGYHFNERWGIEGSYLMASFKENDAVQQFIDDHGTIPNHNTLKNMRGLQLNYIPLYAKMSLLDKKIIYFDMGLGLYLGQTTFTQNMNIGDKDVTEFGYGISVYQHFFFSEHFAFKVDFRNTWTNEERQRYQIGGTEPESARALSKKQIHDTMLLFGITFFL